MDDIVRESKNRNRITSELESNIEFVVSSNDKQNEPSKSSTVTASSIAEMNALNKQMVGLRSMGLDMSLLVTQLR